MPPSLFLPSFSTPPPHPQTKHQPRQYSVLSSRVKGFHKEFSPVKMSSLYLPPPISLLVHSFTPFFLPLSSFPHLYPLPLPSLHFLLSTPSSLPSFTSTQTFVPSDEDFWLFLSSWHFRCLCGRLEAGGDFSAFAGMVAGGEVVCVKQVFLKMFGGSIQKKKGSGIPS